MYSILSPDEVKRSAELWMGVSVEALRGERAVGDDKVSWMGCKLPDATSTGNSVSKCVVDIQKQLTQISWCRCTRT